MSARRLLRAVALTALAFALPTIARAQVVRSEVDARRVGVQDAIQWTVTVEGPALPDQVPLPPLKGLRVIGGPSVATQMSFMNGRASQARSWTWALQPTGTGRAEIGAIHLKLESTEATAPAIAIEVVAGSVKPRAPARRPSPFFDEDPFAGLGRRPAEPRLFVEARPSRSSLYVGEPLLVTYYLYTQTSISGLKFVAAPQYVGFWSEDLEQPERPTGEPATVDGVVYQRFPVLLRLLFPTKAGRLTIPSSSIEIGVPPQRFFDQGSVVQRATKPVTVEVKAIPDDPAFSGAVGRFKASASVDPSRLALGEAATLRFKVEGSGNLKWIERAPDVVVPGAKVYPPQAKSQLQTRPSGIVGSRTWEYVVMPQTTGTLEIPAFSFTWFDPVARRLETSATAPLPLQVAGGAPGAAAPVAPALPGMPASGGPLPLRVDLESGAARLALPGRAVAGIAVAALLLHGLLWGGDRLTASRRRYAGHVAAPASVRGALGELQRIGRDGMSKEAAAGAIERTLRRVFGPLDGDDSERARAVRTLLDQVHEVRYAPQLGDYSEKLRELAARAGDVVRRWG